MKNNKALARLHILKKELGLDDETYRQMLKNETGKESASLLTQKQIFKVIQALEGKTSAKVNYQENAKDARYRACYAIWHKLHACKAVKKNSILAMNAFIARVVPAFASNGNSFALLSNTQANKAVDTLQAWLDRVVKEQVNEQKQ